MRKNLGKRVHKLRLSDQWMIAVLKSWMPNVKHADNPTLEDILELRNMLAAGTDQDLSMLCPFWLRNEMVALRKASKVRMGGSNGR